MLSKQIRRSFAAVQSRAPTNLPLAFVYFWIPVIVFAKIAGEVMEHRPIASDVAILQAIHGQATAALDRLALFVTNFGSAEVIVPITIILAAYLLLRRPRRDLLLLLVGVGGAALANLVLKLLFHRQRPSLWSAYVIERSYSFPSGHAMASSALALCLVLLVWRSRWRWPVAVLATVYVMVVGLSRLYLGVHYPTDVVAGWAVSSIWVIIAYRFTHGGTDD